MNAQKNEVRPEVERLFKRFEEELRTLYARESAIAACGPHKDGIHTDKVWNACLSVEVTLQSLIGQVQMSLGWAEKDWRLAQKHMAADLKTEKFLPGLEA